MGLMWDCFRETELQTFEWQVILGPLEKSFSKKIFAHYFKNIHAKTNNLKYSIVIHHAFFWLLSWLVTKIWRKFNKYKFIFEYFFIFFYFKIFQVYIWALHRMWDLLRWSSYNARLLLVFSLKNEHLYECFWTFLWIGYFRINDVDLFQVGTIFISMVKFIKKSPSVHSAFLK